MSIRKYATNMQVGLQDALVYRANAVIWMLVDSLPAFTMLLIWRAVFRQNEVIGGYRLGDMAAYYLAATFLGVALTPHPEYNISYEVRHGLLSHQLIRPWSYFWALITSESSWQVVKSTMNIPLLAVVVWLFRDNLIWPQLNAVQWVFFAVSVALAYAINMGAKMALGSLAFWIVEPAGIIGIYDSLSWFLQGGVVPVDLFPPWLQSVGHMLPFQYSLAFPVQLMLGRWPATAIGSGLLTQLFWAVFLLGAAGVLWRRGTRIYSAVGG